MFCFNYLYFISVTCALFQLPVLHFSYLYFTDHGSNPRVMRSNLDGSNQQEVYFGLNTPNDVLAGEFGIVFIESNYNFRISGQIQNEPAVAQVYRRHENSWERAELTLYKVR